MIEVKETLIGVLKEKETLTGELNNEAIIIKPISTELEVTPKKDTQVLTPLEGEYFNKVTVEGDDNLIPANISKNVSIFGVQGSMDGIDSTIPFICTGYYEPSSYMDHGWNLKILQDVVNNGFRSNYDYASNFTVREVEFTEGCKRIETQGFYAQGKMTIKNDILPGVVFLGPHSVFGKCDLITKMIMPKIEVMEQSAVGTNKTLHTIDIGENIKQIGDACFTFNPALKTFIIRAITPPTFGTRIFRSTPIADGEGYIYVPDESIDLYKSATNLVLYESQIKKLSELEVES